MTTTAPEHRTLDSEGLTRTAYYHIIEELAGLQYDLAILDLVEQRWTLNALPTKSLLRSHPGVLRDANDIRKRQREHLMERYLKLYAEAEMLEALLLDKQSADMEDFATYIRAKFRKKSKAK